MDGLNKSLLRSGRKKEEAIRLSLLSFKASTVAIVLLLIMALLSGCGSKPDSQDKRPMQPLAAASDNIATPSPSPTGQISATPEKGDDDGEVQAVSDKPAGIVPVRISIPALEIEADIVSLGLTDDGAMDVPSNDDDVAWFAPGYRPGAPGHAVLAGHVDSKKGPAVFYELHRLEKGDRIVLEDADGKKMQFSVIGSAEYPYDDAPLDEIFGPSDEARLNLITCTGLYSRSLGTHQERLVVTAKRIQTD